MRKILAETIKVTLPAAATSYLTHWMDMQETQEAVSVLSKVVDQYANLLLLCQQGLQ